MQTGFVSSGSDAMRKRVREESTDDIAGISSSEEEGEFEEYDGSGKDNDLSEYELARLQSIRENREIYEQLGVANAKSEVSAGRKMGQLAVVRLKSRKIESEIPQKWNNNKNPFNIRKPPVMDMKSINNELEENNFKTIINGWLDKVVKNFPEVVEVGGAEPDIEPTLDEEVIGKSEVCRNSGSSAVGLDGKSDVDLYQMYDDHLVVTARALVNGAPAFSHAWYPSATKRIIFQGDKKGTIGAWDLDRGNEKDSILQFEVHAARPISHLGFDPFDSTKLYSCCVDGTLTCGDFNETKFVRKFAFDERDRDYISHFVWPNNMRNTMLCSTYFGEVINFDLNSGKPVQGYTLGRRLRCIDCHPLNSHIIASVYAKLYKSGVVDIWDWRMLKEGTGNESISSFSAGKAANKVCFSPQTGNKILMTAQDKCVRVLNVDQSSRLSLRHAVVDDHYQGMGIAYFASTWDPKSDNVFTCGSLSRACQVDLFCCEEDTGKLLSSSLQSENLRISPFNIFHPRLPLLASAMGPSSGRVSVWSMSNT